MIFLIPIAAAGYVYWKRKEEEKLKDEGVVGVEEDEAPVVDSVPKNTEPRPADSQEDDCDRDLHVLTNDDVTAPMSSSSHSTRSSEASVDTDEEKVLESRASHDETDSPSSEDVITAPISSSTQSTGSSEDSVDTDDDNILETGASQDDKDAPSPAGDHDGHCNSGPWGAIGKFFADRKRRQIKANELALTFEVMDNRGEKALPFPKISYK